jgi:hypothetical protein
MSIRYTVCGYWPARRECAAGCADRLKSFLKGLALVSDHFQSWYEVGASRREALRKPLALGECERLRHLLNAGRNRRDVDGGIIEDLGFSIALWNGMKDPHAVGLGVQCGLYSANPRLCNSIVLRLPRQLGELRDPVPLTRILSIAAESWEPQWAGVMSTEARMRREPSNFVGLFVDWMIYVSRPVMASLPRLSPPAWGIALDKRGMIVVVQSEPPDPDREEDTGNIAAVVRAIAAVASLPVR